MNSYKAVVAYDGTDYSGWQWQNDMPSIQRTLKETFLGVFKQDDVLLVGASRTDAGVHAQGQVFRVRTPLAIPADKLRWVWNNALPEHIHIVSMEKIDEIFHPQHSILIKKYEYRLFFERPDPMVARYGWFVESKLDFKKLADALSLFVGTHNFRAFCKEEQDKDTIRTVESIGFEKCTKFGGYKIIVKGPSFLRHMIRRIVGAAIAIASKKNLSVNCIKQAFLTKRVEQSLLNAPAKGLCLENIEYQG